MDIELRNKASGSFTCKGMLNSNCLLDDQFALATVDDKKVGDVWVVHDNTSGSYRQYVWSDGWREMGYEGLNSLNIEDLLEYLYDVREYLDSRNEPQKYRNCREACEDYHKDFKTASDMVQFIIDKIRSTTKIEREEKH